jgi:anaphase-promoting complex subunit 5
VFTGCVVSHFVKKFLDPRSQRARQGKYQDAIAVLLEPNVWRGLSLHDYSQWASQIWHIIVLRASRRLSHFYKLLEPLYLKWLDLCSGQLRQYNDLLKAMRPAGTFNPRDYFFGATASTTSIIRDPLYGFLEMQVCFLDSQPQNLPTP